MEIDKILKNIKFDYGWRIKDKFNLFNKEYQITIIFDSYDEKDNINETQVKSLKLLNNDLTLFSDKILDLINNYIIKNNILINTRDITEEIKLTSILFTQDGDVIFLFDVKWDVENGLAVKVIPDYDIGPQDVFL